MMDKLTVIRSVDARFSNHEPNQVFQTGNRAAAPRVNQQEGDKFPAIASIVAKHRGAANRAMPPSVVLNMQSRSHVAWGGYLGKEYDPFLGNQAGSLFKLPGGLDQDRIRSRHDLAQQFDRLRRDLDLHGSMAALDRFEQQAIDIVAGQKAQEVFDLEREPAAVRERYGTHNWCQQALLARRLVEVRRELRDDRPEQSQRLGHLGHARRQHSALWRHLERTAAAAAGVRSPVDDAGQRSRRARACSTTCWCWRWANSAARRRSAPRGAATAAITGRS